MSNFRSKMIFACILGCVIAVVSAIPVMSYAQQKTDFSATLSGKNVVPPVNTPATGTAKFHLNPNGTLSYQVDVNNINGAIGVPIKLKSGLDLAELINIYQTVNQKAFTQSLGTTNGVLAKGVITAANLLGPLLGKNVTDVVPFLANKSASVIVRTQGHQMGEMGGQILPGAAPASSAAAPAAPGMNTTTSAAPAPAAGMNKTGGMGATSLGNMICHYIPQSKSLLCRMA